MQFILLRRLGNAPPRFHPAACSCFLDYFPGRIMLLCHIFVYNHVQELNISMSVTNNITRFLDARKVKYVAHELPAEKLGAVEAAQFMGVAEEQVFKTIVTTREKGKPVLAVVPGPRVVDLKLLAAFLGEKKMSLPSEREAETLTGLQAGGISPLALINKGFQVVIDSAAQEFDEIYISGGQRGLDIQLPVADLMKLVNAKMGFISKDAS
jgi:Cys-tRNA(Pro)/Cys-tRNA(Cys) deacylase